MSDLGAELLEREPAATESRSVMFYFCVQLSLCIIIFISQIQPVYPQCEEQVGGAQTHEVKGQLVPPLPGGVTLKRHVDTRLRDY